MRTQSPYDLTEGQMACLRLVAQHHTSKEIARKLGISRYTVDQRLDAARRKLNAKGRKDAARMFVALEAQSISEPFVYETPALASVHFSSNESSIRAALRSLSGKKAWFGSLPALGGGRRDLSEGEILVRALNVAVFSSLVMALVAAALTGTFRPF